MAWSSALARVPAPKAVPPPVHTPIEIHKPNFERIVTLDFETYFDADYSLRKLSTSEYIRDERFEPRMVGITIGKGKTKVIHGSKIRAALKAIPWQFYSLLCHNTAFDGFILSHHYGIVPKFYYDTLSMARALLRQDISGKLNDVAQFYGVGNKLPDVLELSKGVKDLLTLVTLQGQHRSLRSFMEEYCATDVNLTTAIFKEMVAEYPEKEIQLIDQTIRMFCDPVLKVDIPRVEKELAREILEKEALLFSIIGDEKAVTKEIMLHGKDAALEAARKKIASNESFAALLKAEGVEPPMKVSPAWIKKPEAERDDAKKWAYAFSKTDLDFVELKEHESKRVRDLVEARLSVKSTINETRAGRFLKAGENGQSLPVGYNYAAAHTLRWGGANKTNMQNLRRGSELRKTILAPKGHRIVVADSGQIEPRVNAWFWGQDDLLEGFRLQDTGADRDVYCKFADSIYGREIIKGQDDNERFVGKVGILGLGYQMGAAKLRNTLALGTMGPPVFLTLEQCQAIVDAYRRKHFRIREGWARCNSIIEDMSLGREGQWKCIRWEKDRIWLPNGMSLKYPRLRLKDHAERTKARLKGENYIEPDWPQWVYDRKGEEIKIYGGLLCENLIQALARIIVAEQLLVVARKFRVVMMTHDEIVALARAAQADKALDFMLATMKVPLKWCLDLPLFAEGGHDICYSK